MISFGQLKNNLQLLKKYLTKMQFFSISANKITLKQLEQGNFRRTNNELMLPIINFMITDYSSQFFIKVIQVIPTIKYLPDRQFIEQVFIVVRKFLGMDVSLTVQQFLVPNKYFEKKLEFMVGLAHKIYHWNNVNGNNSKKNNQIKNSTDGFASETISNTQRHKQYDQEQQEEQQEPRVIKAKPIQLRPSNNLLQFNLTVPFNNKKHQNISKLQKLADSDDQDQNLQIKSNKYLASNAGNSAGNSKNNDQKSSNAIIKKYSDKVKDEQQQIYNKYLLDQQKNPIHHRPNKQPQQKQIALATSSDGDENDEQQPQYATKQQANQLLAFMKDISMTISEISTKFDTFQKHVNSQLKNINAKMMMLESNVHMIKQNL